LATYLKVGDGDTTSVEQHVGDDHDVLAGEDVVRCRRYRTVGGLGDELGLDAVGIVLGDLFFAGRGDEEVATKAR